jgi:hypothetical protein
MVSRGCDGIRILIAANPGARFTVVSRPEWYDLVSRELPGIEVSHGNV